MNVHVIDDARAGGPTDIDADVDALRLIGLGQCDLGDRVNCINSVNSASLAVASVRRAAWAPP